MGSIKYWLWLQKSLGCHANIGDLMRVFSNAENLYKAGEAQWLASGIFGTGAKELNVRKIEKMKSVSPDDFSDLIDYCKSRDIKIISPDNEYYPSLLKRIEDYPAVLFVKGDLSCLSENMALAVIGTRTPSAYGVKAAELICNDLVKENTVIVSGGALGIDSIAHSCAVNNNGKTVLVLGCGHDCGYLKENEELRFSVSKNGAVISEYSPLTKASPILFPKRNRIIAGMSQGVVVIEAGLKSGTLNTASHARRQNRDIFAVPGDISSDTYAGSNKLILQGAHAVFSARDILNFYSDYVPLSGAVEKGEAKYPFAGIDQFDYGEPKKIKTGKKNKNKEDLTDEKSDSDKKNSKENKKLIKISAESVSENAFLVYNILSDEKITLDEIVRKSSLPIRKVLISITELEMLGAVSLCEGNSYIKN